MKVTTHLIVFALQLAVATSCTHQATESPPAPQAVRAVVVRIGPVVEGRRHLAEVVPERQVLVLAQVPGTVSSILAAEGAQVSRGAPLLRVSAPDVAARVSRIRTERERAERERDFLCKQLVTDRLLAKSGDLTSFQLDRSEKSCASANLAVRAARGAEREASVAKARRVERTPFDGEVLTLQVDEGQTVMPGTPLLQYGTRARRLRLRVPTIDLRGTVLGTRVHSELGPGRVVKIGARTLGPGRLVEVLVKMDNTIELRVGSTVTTILVVAERADACSVPIAAVGGEGNAPYVLVVNETRLRRMDVKLGPRANGWVAIEPALPKGSRVAVGALSSIDLSVPVLVVSP